MEFDTTHKVIIETMTKEEASAFVKFLGSEIRRHQIDIKDAEALIRRVKGRYDLWI